MIFSNKLAVILIALAAQGGRAASAPGSVNPDIIGGVAAQKDDLPFIVSTTKNGSNWCTGSLLDAYTVLTAAHCFRAEGGRNASLYRVRAGSLNRLSGGVELDVSHVLPHPGFRVATAENDIAIMRLSFPILSSTTGGPGCIRYAVLPPRGYYPPPGLMTTVAGWGVTIDSEDAPFPEIYRELDQPVISRSDCQAMYPYGPDYTITTGMWCAGYGKDGKTFCWGDSGGPGVDTKSKVLLGIMSWVPDEKHCIVYGETGVLTNVASYLDWIHENMW